MNNPYPYEPYEAKVVGDTLYVPNLGGEAARALDDELGRARDKFPGTRFLLAALQEEVGELARAYLQRQGDPRIRKEALQCATVAMRIFLEGDSSFNDVSDDEARP